MNKKKSVFILTTDKYIFQKPFIVLYRYILSDIRLYESIAVHERNKRRERRE